MPHWTIKAVVRTELGVVMDKRFFGSWFFEEMELWGGSDLDLLGPANITFDDDGYGSVQFVAVVGLIDCEFSEQDGKPFVEFSWQGHDDSDDACGRGWGAIEGDGKLLGRIFIHWADNSAFTAKRER
jgi:hypothetical protein